MTEIREPDVSGVVDDDALEQATGGVASPVPGPEIANKPFYQFPSPFAETTNAPRP